MKIYQLGKGVYQYYKSNVKGNEDTPYELAQRKLTRNIALAAKVNEEYYMYGNLHIVLNGNTIVKIMNYREPINWFYKNKKQYYRLNKILMIDKMEKSLKNHLSSNQKNLKTLMLSVK